MATTKKTGSFHGKSNKLGHGGRAAQLKAKGVNEISVVSETLTTHEYESKVLAKAFEEITGIKVKHDIIQEGDVVEKLQTSMQ